MNNHAGAAYKRSEGTPRPVNVAVVAGVCILSASSAPAQHCQPGWIREFGSEAPNGAVMSMVSFDPGNGRSLYAGGFFWTIGGLVVNGVARWDGRQWSPLSSGVQGRNGGHGGRGYVQTLAVFGGQGGEQLFAGGNFTRAGQAFVGSIASWNGTTWQDVGGGVVPDVDLCWDCSGTVQAFTTGPIRTSPALFIAGNFKKVGTEVANNIAAWRSGAWTLLGSGLRGEPILPIANALAWFGNSLYVGGLFTEAGGISALGLAQWNELGWSDIGGTASDPPLPPGVVPGIWAMAVFDDGSGDSLYIGGYITRAGTVPVRSLARWDGSSWHDVGGGVDGAIYAMTEFDDGSGPALYVGGSFTTAGGILANNIARWDGKSWSSLSIGTDGEVRALTAWDRDGLGPEAPGLYVGGGFSTAGGINSPRIAKWQGCDTCYPDCDTTTGPRNLDIFDFLCFQNRYVAGTSYACDCDASTGPGVCDIFDFLCFQNAYADGCP